MEQVIPVIHPGPVRFVPRGARTARTAAIRLVTPAPLPVADPADFRPIEGGGPRTALMAMRDGLPWARLQAGYATRSARPIPAGAFLAWLKGEDAGRLAGDIDDLLRGTPLVAATSGTEGAGHHQHRCDRGTRERPPRAADILHDGCPDAPAALRAFLAREVALVGEAVMVRVRPLATLRLTGGLVHAALAERPRSVANGQLKVGSGPLPVGVDRVGPAALHWFGKAAGHSRDLDAYAAALDREGRPGLAAADDLHHLAHALPPFVADQLSLVGPLEHPFPPALARIESLDRRLAPLRCRAMVGAIPEEGHAAALDLVDEAVEAIAVSGKSHFMRLEMEALRTYLGSEAAGRLRLPDADADALDGLAP